MSSSQTTVASFAVNVPDGLAGERVDKAISLFTGVSRRVATELLTSGRVRIDGSPVTTRSRALGAGQLLEVVGTAPQPGPGPVADPSVVFTVVHEDASVVVVDKPPGLVVHLGAGTKSSTLVNGLLARYPDLEDLPRMGSGEPDRPGIVHRLDKGTSGLLVVARTVQAYRSLVHQFREHSAGRNYTALVEGDLGTASGIVDAPIGRSARRPERMSVSMGGKPATTRYKVVRRYFEPVPATLLEVTLTTGRTHQIRVHLAAIGHPVVGDERYGGSVKGRSPLGGSLRAGRQFLHAHTLEIEHPEGGRVRWTTELPPDLLDLLGRLEPA